MKSHILLIEDEPGLVLTITDLLSGEGYTVDSAMDGVSGLAKAVAGGHDLIVLDVMLPGKRGHDVCRELRQQGRDVAVLMLTAKGQVVDRVVGLKLGADDYLAKPFDLSILIARLSGLLRRSRWNEQDVPIPAETCSCVCAPHFDGPFTRDRSISQLVTRAP